MKEKRNKEKLLYVTQAAMIAAIYVVLVQAFAPISFRAVQCRIAEALTILPYFTPAAIPGVTIGCLLGNILGGCDILDISFGTLATFLGAAGTYTLRRYKWLAPVPPILSNTIIIPWVLRFAYADTSPVYFLMATVGIGEVISCGVMGMILLLALKRYQDVIFPNTEAGIRETKRKSKI